jgi:hypothetical protein
LKSGLPWILLGIAIAVILYLVFRPLPVINNKDQIKQIETLTDANNLLRKSLNAEFFNFSSYKDSTTHVIDSLQGRNIDLKSRVNITEAEKQDLALQILNHKPNESIDSPCFELARKVLADSLIIGDYQKNTERLIFTFNDAVTHRDTIISHQQDLILSDSVLIAQQKDLYKLQEQQLKKVQRQGKTSAWLARSLSVVALVLGGILLTK